MISDGNKASNSDNYNTTMWKINCKRNKSWSYNGVKRAAITRLIMIERFLFAYGTRYLWKRRDPVMFSILHQFVYHDRFSFARYFFQAFSRKSDISRRGVATLRTLACAKSYDQKKGLALFYKPSHVRTKYLYYGYNMHLRDKRSNGAELSG